MKGSKIKTESEYQLPVSFKAKLSADRTLRIPSRISYFYELEKGDMIQVLIKHHYIGKIESFLCRIYTNWRIRIPKPVWTFLGLKKGEIVTATIMGLVERRD